MPISRSKASELLQFITDHPQEAKSPGTFYVSSATLAKFGLSALSLQEEPFTVSKEHFSEPECRDVIMYAVDRAALEAYAQPTFLGKLLGHGKGHSR